MGKRQALQVENLTSRVTAVLLTALLAALAGLWPPEVGPALGADGPQATPELAAKREMVRRQQEQRITPEQLKAAAQALKEQRIKVHKARQGARHPAPGGAENR